MLAPAHAQLEWHVLALTHAQLEWPVLALTVSVSRPTSALTAINHLITINIHFQDNDPLGSRLISQSTKVVWVFGVQDSWHRLPFWLPLLPPPPLPTSSSPHASTPPHIPSRMRLFSTGLKAMSNHSLHWKCLTSRSHGTPQELKRRWSSSWTMHLIQGPAPASLLSPPRSPVPS